MYAVMGVALRAMILSGVNPRWNKIISRVAGNVVKFFFVFSRRPNVNNTEIDGHSLIIVGMLNRLNIIRLMGQGTRDDHPPRR